MISVSWATTFAEKFSLLHCGSARWWKIQLHVRHHQGMSSSLLPLQYCSESELPGWEILIFCTRKMEKNTFHTETAENSESIKIKIRGEHAWNRRGKTTWLISWKTSSQFVQLLHMFFRRRQFIVIWGFNLESSLFLVLLVSRFQIWFRYRVIFRDYWVTYP